MVNDKNILILKKQKVLKNILLFYSKNKVSFFLFMIILLLQLPFSKENDIIYPEINLIMEGPGTKQIFSYSIDTIQKYVSEVIVNGINKTDICLKNCELKDNINNISIIFKKNVETCRNMFYNSSFILEIDLSKFDVSSVTDMSGMFCGCSRLTSINFKN